MKMFVLSIFFLLKDLAESFNNNDVGYGMQSSTTFLINGDSTKQKKSKKRHSTDDYTEPIDHV